MACGPNRSTTALRCPESLDQHTGYGRSRATALTKDIHPSRCNNHLAQIRSREYAG
jgi:hypothetical protein